MGANVIGIAGGMGPLATIDVIRRIYSEVGVKSEEDYSEVHIISSPNRIPDRTKFVLGETDENPAYEIAENIIRLKSIGSGIIGIPCNTAHSKIIFDEIERILSEKRVEVMLVNMISCVHDYVMENCKNMRVGVLGTKGTYKAEVYKHSLIDYVYPDDIDKNLVHNLIYSEEYGIKYYSHPVKNVVKIEIESIISELMKRGVEVVVLGCTELPLAVGEGDIEVIFINPNEILAKKLIELS